MASFVAHLECSSTGDRYEPGRLRGLSVAGRPLLVRYDLDAIEAAVSRDALLDRPADMWRYRELLPVADGDPVVSLGEDVTPLLEIADEPGLLVKDESRLPTGSFEARGAAVAVTVAAALGVDRVALASGGSSGAAVAAYAARAGIRSFVFFAAGSAETDVRQAAMLGARVWTVDGTAADCTRLVAEGVREMGWFDLGAFREPYRLEGKKAMAFELAEQLGWQLPDVVIHATAEGSGVVAMWKAFQELRSLGWVAGRLPRLIAVQPMGCPPLVRAWESGAERAEPWTAPVTTASSLRVDDPFADTLVLKAIRESAGAALAVDDDAVAAARAHLASAHGLLVSMEGAAAYAGYRRAVERGLVEDGDRAVAFNGGSGLKQPMPATDRVIGAGGEVDWAHVEASV